MLMDVNTAKAVQGLTLKYAELVNAIKYEDIPENVLQKAKLIIRDGIGNQIAASAISEPALKVIQLQREWGGKAHSTVVGYGFQITRYYYDQNSEIF